MDLLTEEILPTLIGKTIYWKVPDGPEGITTILSIIGKEIRTHTVSGEALKTVYINKARYKSYGRFVKT